MTVYVNVWRPVHVTHACVGDGKTLCGLDCVGVRYEEGTDFEADEAETYVNCRKCLRSIENRERTP